MLRALFVFGVAAVALGCESSPYRCDPTHACNAGSVCAPAGYCAEPVAPSLCPSGLRYSASAAAPGTCAPNGDAAAPDVLADAEPDAADASTDLAPMDAEPDAPGDASPDVPPDVALDAPPDLAPMDAPPDVAFDAAPDVAFDAAPDVALDARPDVALDAAPDVRPDVALDAAPDARPDAAPDAPADAARDVGPDLTTAPDASGPCTVWPVAPIAGTRISSNTLSVTLAFTGSVSAGTIEYSATPGGPITSVPLSMRGTGRLGASLTALGRRVFWRYAVRCGDGSPQTSPVWWTQHRRAASATQGVLGWVPDVNGDGLADVVASATRVSDVPFVRAYLGGAGTGFETLPMPSADDGYGARVAVVPDMNGDGAAEVAVGSCVREAGAICVRTVNVYSRRAGMWALYTSVLMPPVGSEPGLRMDARFGATLAGVGDLDEDGYGDLLIGAPPNDDADAGAIYILYGGRAPTLSPAYSLTAMPTAVPPRRRFAWSAAGVGDLNLDGHVDFVVTSFERVWVYRGGGTRALPMAEELAITVAASAGQGLLATAAGDLDGDHLADFALGRVDDTSAGQVTVVRGRATPFAGLGERSSGVHSADGSGGGFGMTVLGTLDYDGDSLDELIIGAPRESPGRVYAAWLLGPSLVTQQVDPPTSVQRFGRALGAPGDQDGDGLDDLAVSSLNAGDSVGLVHLLHGTTSVSMPFTVSATLRAQPHTFGQEIGR